MSDIDDLLARVQVGAEKRGIRVLDAAFPTEPTVVFDESTTSVEDALDVAQAQFATFLSVDVTTLDHAEIEDLWDEEDPLESGPPPKVQRIFEEHEGDSDGLFLRWLANGAVFLYVAVPEWRIELNVLLEAEQVAQTLRRVDERLAHRIRVTHLADQIEGDPAFRAGNAQTRRSIGRTLLAPLLKSDEDARFVQFVLDNATRLARDNSIAVYSELVGSVDELATELRLGDAWQAARTSSERTKAARDLLESRADGYAPAVALVESLRRTAEIQ